MAKKPAKKRGRPKGTTKKTAKKATKKKAASKKTKKKTEADDKASPRLSMCDVNAKYIETTGSSFTVTPEQYDIFTLNRIYTSLIDVDYILKPAFGNRICIIGNESTGKSVMCHIFEAAAQRTCRKCFLPIIEWQDPISKETKTTCKCGKNEPMVVLHIDVEDSFDPVWARRWGVRIGDDRLRQRGFDLIKSDDETFWVALPRDGNYAFDFAVDAIEHGAVDMVVFDSLAMMTPREVLAPGVGETRISPLARLASEGLTKIVNAQIKSKADFNGRSTVIWTNQYYQGPVRNPKQDPNRPSAGKKSRYVADLEMKIISCAVDFDARRNRVGADKSARYIDVKFEAKKSKVGGPPLGQGAYRLYLDSTNTRQGPLTAGDTDDYNRLFAYLDALGYYKKTSNAHIILGREFKKVADMRAFLARRDTGYIARYLIFREMLSVTSMDHLKKEHYGYSPFGLDPIIKDTENRDSDQVDLPGTPEENRKEESWVDESLEETK